MRRSPPDTSRATRETHRLCLRPTRAEWPVRHAAFISARTTGPVRSPLRAGLRVPPAVFDMSLAEVLLLVTVGLDARIYQHPSPSPLLQVALSLPLVWRRRAPLAVFSAVAAAAFVQWLADVQSLTDVALLV